MNTRSSAVKVSSTPLRVLHVINGLGQGGAESMLTRIATMPVVGEEQRVVSLMDSGVLGASLSGSGIGLDCLGARRGAATFGLLWRLRALIRLHRPDVIMSWLYHSDLIALLAVSSAGLTPRSRLIWNLRCSDMDFSRYPRSTRLVVTALARLSHLPAVVAANSSAGRAAHEALGYAPVRWAHLPNGVDLSVWRPPVGPRDCGRVALGLPADGPLIGFVARVDPQKDHGTFFSAAERIHAARPDARFVLIGAETDQLRPPVSIADRVHALGLRRDVPELMRRLDLHILTSAYGEGFPNVLVEAMASGALCVSTDVGDAREILGGVGSVAPRRDSDALAAATIKLLSEDSDSMAARRAAARARVAARYGLKQVRTIYSELWRSVAAEPKAPQHS